MEIAATPSDARLDSRMRAVLVEASRIGAVAVLTGRTIADADRILGGAIEAIAGLHGLESRLASEQWRRRGGAHDAVRKLAAALNDDIAAGNLNALMEDKGASIALHFRHAPEEEARVTAAAEQAAAAHGLRTLRGKMVVEILPAGATKGDALREFMHLAPFAGRRPIAVGDDVTDESAFEAANALGGESVLVGALRQTSARERVDTVADVETWLASAVERAR